MTKQLHPCPDVPGGLCPCRCHAIRASVRKRTRRDAWLPRHIAAIREMAAAGAPPSQIAPALTARFHVERTESSVRRIMRIQGISTRDGWRSRDDVIKLLGISERKLLRVEADGLLSDVAFGRWRRYRVADLEKLIREQAGRSIDPRRVRDPRLRSLAEVSAVVNMRSA